jgi:hypothetical protein
MTLVDRLSVTELTKQPTSIMFQSLFSNYGRSPGENFGLEDDQLITVCRRNSARYAAICCSR